MSKKGALELLRRASRELESGRPARAIEACTAALELDPRSADAFQLRGVAYNERKKLKEAIADFSSALRLRPGMAEVHYNRGFARLDAGDEAGAVRDFTAALRNPSLRRDPELLLGRASGQLALGKLRAARRDATALIEALEADRAARERSYKNVPARSRRALLAGLLARIEEATDLLARIDRASGTVTCP